MSIVLVGSTSGSVTLQEPAIAGTTVIDLPATSGTMVVTGGAQTVQFAAGSAAAPSITFTGDTNTGIFSPGADAIAFTEGGVESMRIDASGNVGIGMTPVYKLDVTGGNGNAIRYTNSADGVQVALGAFNSTGFFGTLNNFPQLFYTNSAERMRIDSSGNVGIGTTSPAAAYRLSLTGTTGVVGGVSMTSGGNSAFIGQIGAASADCEFWNAANGYVRIGTNNAERMRITSAGNVGIGTSAPEKTLEVYANNASTTTTTGLLVTNFSLTGNSRAGIVFRNYDSYSSAIWSPRTGSSAGELVFGTKTDIGIAESNITERMRITSGGSVLINNNGSWGNQFLRVKGGATTGVIGLSVGANANGAIDWYNASDGYVASVIVNASSVSYNTTSDYRLKENIAPMTGALAKVSQLKPVTYTWKADGSDGQGFIAHELQAVVPDAVTGEKDAVDAEGNPKYQGVDTSFLVATLTAAIQEQQQIINDLKARIETLESK